jgi:hypothetical protein
MVTHPAGEGLRSLGFPLEVRIENDASTFNTVHLAGLVFLLRDAIGDQAAVFASNGRAHWECLWGSSWFFEVHGAPPGRESVLPADVHYRNSLVSPIQGTRYRDVGDSLADIECTV